MKRELSGSLWAKHRGTIIVLVTMFLLALLAVYASSIFFQLLGFSLNLAYSAVMQIFYFFIMFFYLAGRVKKELYLPGDLPYSWDDYRGAPELVKRMKTYLELLKGYGVYEAAGGRPPSGILLEGPPGTGKSYLAKVMAAECGVPFMSVDCSTLQGTFVGISPLKVSGIFRKCRGLAKAYGACILFLDEIDAVARRRSSGADAAVGMLGGMWGSQVLTTLLIELDGLREARGLRWRWRRRVWRLFGKQPVWRRPRLLVIGSTNIAEVLDPALKRPGRLGEIVRIDLGEERTHRTKANPEYPKLERRIDDILERGI